MSNNNLDETKIDPKDGDIPFILCTPTKNDNDEVALILFDAEESPRLNFFLKPRRSCKCPLGCECHEQNNMNIEPTWTWNDGDRDLSGEQLERNTSSSPVPTDRKSVV